MCVQLALGSITLVYLWMNTGLNRHLYQFQSNDTFKEEEMDLYELIPLIFALGLCAATESFLKTEHLRVKRWEGTGDMSNMFRGTAGVDYPDLKTIPNTNFRCENQEYEGGLYADVETRCQVYHVCHDGRKNSFMCGRGTIFNQQILACDYWYSTECDNAPSYYYVNSQISNSDTSWVPPPKDNSYNIQTNTQGIGYESNNPGTYNNQDNRRAADLNGGISGPGQESNDQKPCCCLKNAYKAPWNFPSHLLSPNRKK